MRSCEDGYPSCRHAEATGEWCKGKCKSGRPSGAPRWPDKRITIAQVRMIVVEAIRDATGRPDIVGRDGVSLVEKIEQLARKV